MPPPPGGGSGLGDWSMFGREPTHNRRSPYVGAQTATLKWAFTTDGYVSSSPAIALNGTVYVLGSDGFLYAIDPEGNQLWQCATGYSANQSVIRSSPAIGTDGTIYVGSPDKSFYAVNPDGSIKWSHATGGMVFPSPTICTDGTVYVGSFDNRFYRFNPDGSLKWSYDMDSINGGFSSTAIGADGTVDIGARDHTDVSTTIGMLLAINPDGTLKWSYSTGDGWCGMLSSPAIGEDGTVYVGSQDGKLYAFGP